MRVNLLAGAAVAAVAAVLLSLGAVAAQPAGTPEFGAFGLDPDGPDPSVAAGDDFFRHANGHWLATARIPADRAWYGDVVRLRDQSNARVRDILEAADRQPAGPEAKKLGDLYASFMDEAAIEAKGTAPLKSGLAKIAAIRTPDDLARTIAQLTRMSPPVPSPEYQYPIRPSVDADLKDPTRYAATLDQGGLGLPDRDYYLGADRKMAEARAAYRTYIVTLFTLAGLPNPGPRADAIIAFEKSLAQVHWTRVDLRDVEKGYNPMTPRQLAASAPGFSWGSYLAEAGLGGVDTLVVGEPSAFTGFARLAAATPMPLWRDYLTLHAIIDAAPYLPKAFVDADFAFHGKALTGQPQIRARYKRGSDIASLEMGQAIGKIYARRFFPASSKAAMARRIDALAWMTPQTKLRAKTKLANLLVQVGYPDTWRDYSGLQIVRGDPLGNAQRAAAFEYGYGLGKLRRPVDREEWDLFATPQTVNAFNAGQYVKLLFPAAYLSPPFFDPNADPAVNYGAIGATIGHEISHSFDDQGAKLDEMGRLRTWWTPADEAAFKLAKEFDGYEPLPGVHVNGHLVLGESVADLAGLVAALDAYHASLHGRPAPVIGGLTGDQRFFLSYGQSWREKMRDELLRQLVTTDPHPPSEYRADTVRNVDAWYTTFGVKPGQTLYLAPARRVKIW